MQQTGAHGWPLVPSTHFPGEQTLACPACGSTSVVLTSMGSGAGSGPGGRHRFGDNYLPVIECRACGKRDIGKARMHVVNGGTREI